jgi:hypothetical protein
MGFDVHEVTVRFSSPQMHIPTKKENFAEIDSKLLS